MRRPNLRYVAVAALAVAAAACSSSSKVTSTTTPTTTTALAGSSTSAVAVSTTSVPNGGAVTPTSPPASSLPDPCSILTANEVGSYLTRPATATKVGRGDCDFDAGSGRFLRLTLSQSRQVFNADMQHFNGTAVSGIGDAAFLAKPNSIVEIIKGSTVVALQPQGALVDQTDVAKLEMLARTAAAHL